MDTAIDLLEAKRKKLGLTQTELVRRLGLREPIRTRAVQYNGIIRGDRPLPQTWLKKVADFLEVPESALMESNGALQHKRLSAAELREFADIVERIGRPLSIETLNRVAKEMKAEGSG
jgi:transcriptional regulator with XRE-family HTH domain